MNTYADKTQQNKSQYVASAVSQKQDDSQSTFQFVDNRPEVITLRRLQEMANNSPQVKQLRAFQGMAKEASKGTVIQRYTDSQNGQFHISENNQFAVSSDSYPDSIYVNGGAPPLAIEGRLRWNQQGTINIDNTEYNQLTADISEYEAEGNVGSEEHCGAFARHLADDNNVIAGEDRSTGDPGTVLKDGETSPTMDDGWENHFATVVKVDGGDHATFETAVGIPHTWVGIYGVNRGQTFKYKTQVANIQRMLEMEDIVLAGQGPRTKTWWQYLLCCHPGTATDLTIPRGITEEDAATYQAELTAWRDNGTQPTSPYMIQIVEKLEAELLQTGGQ